MANQNDSERISIAKSCWRIPCWFMCRYKKLGKHSEIGQLAKRPRNQTASSVQQIVPRPSAKRQCKLTVTGHQSIYNLPSDQLQSSFLSLLPTEIRLEIFNYVLGGRRHHLGHGDGRKRPYLCRRPCVWTSSSSGWNHASCWDQQNPSLDDMLPLLQSCSRM